MDDALWPSRVDQRRRRDARKRPSKASQLARLGGEGDRPLMAGSCLPSRRLTAAFQSRGTSAQPTRHGSGQPRMTAVGGGGEDPDSARSGRPPR